MSSSDKRLWVIAGVLFAVAAVLGVWTFWPDGGDSGSPREDSSQQDDPSSSQSPSPSKPPVPVLPGEIDSKSVTGAKETIKYYYEALNYLIATGDGDPYRKVVDTNFCTRCADTLSIMEGIWRDGGWIKGGQLEIEKIDDVGISNPSPETMTYTANVTVNRAAGEAFDAADGTTETSEPFTETGEVLLFFNGERWAFNSVGKEQEG